VIQHGRPSHGQRRGAHEPWGVRLLSKQRLDLALQHVIARTGLRQKRRTLLGSSRQRRATVG